MGQSINHMIFLVRSIPQYILCVQNRTSVADGATLWKSFHQERTYPRLPPFPGYYTDTGSSWEQNQLSLEFAAIGKSH